jgi:MFS family permease
MVRGKVPTLSRSRTKWVVLTFAFLATVINYLDRQTLSVMAPVLLARFHISAEAYSGIIFAFMLAYTVMNGVSGRFLDWVGSRIGYALIIAWWSAAEMLHVFSAGAMSLGVFRFLLGFGEAAFIALLKTSGDAATMRRAAVLLFSALMVPAVFAGGHLSAAACIGLISLATFGYCGALANLLAIPGDGFPSTVVASIWGFASMGSGIGAMLFSLLTGWLVERYSFQPVFVVFGVLPVIAAWIVWTLPRQRAAAEVAAMR